MRKKINYYKVTLDKLGNSVEGLERLHKIYHLPFHTFSDLVDYLGKFSNK